MNRLTHNWNLKLMALVLAIALWSHVRGEVNPEETATLAAPLAIRAPQGFALAGGARLPASVQVTLRAPRQTLRGLHGGTAISGAAAALASRKNQGADADDEVRAVLDWTGARRGEQSVPVKIEVGAPDVEVVGTKPSDVVVSLAKVSKSAH